jgi:hypothetical protein
MLNLDEMEWLVLLINLERLNSFTASYYLIAATPPSQLKTSVAAIPTTTPVPVPWLNWREDAQVHSSHPLSPSTHLATNPSCRPCLKWSHFGLQCCLHAGHSGFGPFLDLLE